MEIEPVKIKKDRKKKVFLYDADTKCKHVIKELWSGIKCTKCSGWYCV